MKAQIEKIHATTLKAEDDPFGPREGMTTAEKAQHLRRFRLLLQQIRKRNATEAQ